MHLLSRKFSPSHNSRDQYEPSPAPASSPPERTGRNRFKQAVRKSLRLDHILHQPGSTASLHNHQHHGNDNYNRQSGEGDTVVVVAAPQTEQPSAKLRPKPVVETRIESARSEPNNGVVMRMPSEIVLGQAAAPEEIPASMRRGKIVPDLTELLAKEDSALALSSEADSGAGDHLITSTSNRVSGVNPSSIPSGITAPPAALAPTSTSIPTTTSQIPQSAFLDSQPSSSETSTTTTTSSTSSSTSSSSSALAPAAASIPAAEDFTDWCLPRIRLASFPSYTIEPDESVSFVPLALSPPPYYYHASYARQRAAEARSVGVGVDSE